MVNFIDHVRSFSSYAEGITPLDKIHSISHFRFKEYCSIVFDYFFIDYYTKNRDVILPTNIDNILLTVPIYLNPHSCTANCIFYKNKINNNLIYCQRDLLEHISNYYFIDNNQTLIIGDGDPNVKELDVKNLSYKLCCSANLLINNIKHIPLPTGIRVHSEYAENIVLQHLLNNTVKHKSIYVNFQLATNKDRNYIFNICKKLNLVKDIIRLSHVEYWSEMKKYFFIISPESNGVESSRTWEALYSQTIPVVKRSIVTEFYSKIFPMIVLDDWEQLANYKFDYYLYYKIMSQYPDYTKYLHMPNLWTYILAEMERREILIDKFN